ncbi:MAG: deoxyribonuclease IV [Clostridiales bacterium]|nr:deoxyribonuclease IV [Clostridiales bacterium]
MDSTFKIGAHMSVSGGYKKMAENIIRIGGSTAQFFSRNPRGGALKERNFDDEAAAHEILSGAGINPADFIAHAPYIINPCSSKPEVREYSAAMMREDIERLGEIFPGIMYNFHPGSHTGQGIPAGIKETAHCLAEVVKPDDTVRVLIETMAGKGSELGGKFEEIREIIDEAERENPDIAGKIGVCLDTCHISDGGYDIVGDLDGVVERFDSIIGLDRLWGIHLNDSKNPCGSKKDRHEVIGGGTIGLDALCRVINHPRLRNLSFCLETPNELEGYKNEISLLRERRDEK